MSFEITTAFVQQYNSSVIMLSQQKGSRFRRAVRNETQVGKNEFFDRIGATAAQKRTTRHGDTPLMNTPHSRRRVSLADYDWGDLVDNLDKIRTLIDPTNQYTIAASNAMGRSMDDVIAEAFFGTAYSGEEGSTSVTFPTAQQIAAGGVGLTVAKLRTARKMLKANEVEGKLYCGISAEQEEELLATTEVTSSDYNSVKALVHGEVNTFLGFDFIRSERLPTDSSGDRRIPCWTEQAMVLSMGKEPVARISERADKNYSVQVYNCMALGATRLEDEAVVEIKCVE